MLVVQDLPATGRVLRKPQHSFQVRQQPWQIQPCVLAPVLPGETLKNLLLQARVVTDPIKNPLIGWWMEYYFFYVKHRDLEQRDILTKMVLDFQQDVSSLRFNNNFPQFYHKSGQINWLGMCMKRIVEEYFRDDGETESAGNIGGIASAAVSGNSFLDSLTDTTALPDGSGSPAGETGEQEDLRRIQYEFMRANALTRMDYDEWLRTYGVKQTRTELHKPELIRYVRDWTYPSNTVEATTGVPSSACSWAISERADKDRYFTEPGFIVGCSVARPKVYMSRQVANASGYLDSAFAWLPALMEGEPAVSLREFASAGGPLAATTNAYWLDLRDLYLYGDQFLNFALTETNAGLVALPTAACQRKYASAADADALFVTPIGKNLVRSDGVVNLSIMGRQVDQT